MRIHAAVATAIALAFHTTLASQGPSPSLLPANTRVIAHFDTQKCLRVLGKELIQAQLRRHGDNELRGALERAESKWGFNPLRDIVGVTVFGNPMAKGTEPSVMLWVNDRIDRVVEELQDAGALVGKEHEGVRLGRLSVKGLSDALGVGEVRGDHAAWLYIRRVGDRRAMLFGKEPGDILLAARVLEGDAPSLSDASSPAVDAKGVRGAMAYVEIGGPLQKLIRSGPASAIAKKVKHIKLAVREEEGQIRARAILEVGSTDDARNIASLIEGLRGLAALSDGELIRGAPEFVKTAIGSVSCRVDDNNVILEMGISSDELRQHLGGRSKPSRSKSRRSKEKSDNERRSLIR